MYDPTTPVQDPNLTSLMFSEKGLQYIVFLMVESRLAFSELALHKPLRGRAKSKYSANLHVDTNKSGFSFIIGLGDYTGR